MIFRGLYVNGILWSNLYIQCLWNWWTSRKTLEVVTEDPTCLMIAGTQLDLQAFAYCHFFHAGEECSQCTSLMSSQIVFSCIMNKSYITAEDAIYVTWSSTHFSSVCCQPLQDWNKKNRFLTPSWVGKCLKKVVKWTEVLCKWNRENDFWAFLFVSWIRQQNSKLQWNFLSWIDSELCFWICTSPPCHVG